MMVYFICKIISIGVVFVIGFGNLFGIFGGYLGFFGDFLNVNYIEDLIIVGLV